MATIKSTIRINITNQTKSRAQKGFNVICVTGPNLNTANRVEIVTELSQVAALLTNGASDPEYTACEDIFSQPIRPDKVFIGKYISGTDADYGEALDAIAAENPKFYCVVITSRLVVDQTSAAEWVVANERVFVCSSADANIVDTPADTANIAYILKTANNPRSTVFYHAQAATEFLDAAIAAVSLVNEAGTYTMAYQANLVGITANDLSPTQQANAHAQFCSTYEPWGDDDVSFFGWVSSGQYFDSVHFIDYIAARLGEAIARLLVLQKKVSFDDPGIKKVKSKMIPVFNASASEENGGSGALTPQSIDPTTNLVDGGYEITVPAASTITDATKATRIFSGTTFTMWYSGAIHEVEIDGVLTL